MLAAGDLVKLGLVMVATAALAGCANETASPSHLGAGTQAAMLSNRTVDEHADLERAARQTVAAKITAAIALQRVTGRVPDPARFNELRR